MSNNLEAFIVRLPSELHTKIKTTAKADRRSMNNEIVGRLEGSFSATRLVATDDKLKAVLFEHIATLEEEIERLHKQLPASR
ncbi:MULTISPECIES: Arc family DNA-binding protein [unclassified Pseudomonas]|uniref:Arc family DNA-binding protein n=1 Tax=unclassified Pseudomonas TaxID=196821 RepID=UPI0021D9C33A|nr:Arc family DNA-binding protein [Pseudomonas sp. YeP6b]UXZ19879.1 Arc family DNA-binding protein [Pseudomonas sp. YeP6b]